MSRRLLIKRTVRIYVSDKDMTTEADWVFYCNTNEGDYSTDLDRALVDHKYACIRRVKIYWRGLTE